MHAHVAVPREAFDVALELTLVMIRNWRIIRNVTDSNSWRKSLRSLDCKVFDFIAGKCEMYVW